MATNRVFSAKLLKQIQSAHLAEEFTAQFKNGFWRSPKFSLRRQADMRKACLLNSIDPASIGLSEKTVSLKKTKKMNKPKGHKHQRNYMARQEEINQALQDMPTKIQTWKDDLAKEKAKLKPSLPF
ncbi:hypothetical protein H4219_001331 [Mycoemilia scoparia]|uniref:Large ribosomal subunit protein mL59 domain-containing protein n=1 Tax=Mycoemilia scoparia TaxID=417184 RepID=A0A9W8A6U0_9FUNG|nr:hypothetical protein H4219_001331 [Mycoemilia scoparia]